MGRKAKEPGKLQSEIPPEERGFVKMTTPGDLVERLKTIAAENGLRTPQRALRLVLDERDRGLAGVDLGALEAALVEQLGPDNVNRIKAALDQVRHHR